MAPQVPDLIFSKYLSICPQVNIFDFLSGHVMLEKYQNFVARHWTPTIALASLKVATAIEIASSAAESILPGPKYINIAKTIQSAPMPDPTRLVPVTQIAEQVISTCKVDILSTYAVILLFIFLMTIIVLLLIIIALIVTGHTRAKFPNSSPLPLDMPTSHLSVSSTPVSTLGADHHDNPSSPDPLPFPVMAISESPLRSMEWMILMLCLIEIKQCKQDRLQFDKRMTEAFDLFKQALRLSDFEDVVDGQVSANVDNVQDTYVEASPTPAVVSIVTFEDASGSSHLLESAPSTLERSPFRAPTLLVDLAVPSVSVELEREVSTSIASTEIVLEETSVTDDLPKSTLSILNQLPFYSPSPILSPLLVDAILQFSPNNTSIALETEDSNSVISTASVLGTADFEVLFESTSSAVSSSPKSPVDQILPFALAEEISTNTAVLADSPVKEDSLGIDHRVIVADSDTLSSSPPSTTPAAVTCSSSIDLPITKSKEDGTAVNESLYHLMLEVSNDLPGALFAAPEVSVLEDFGTKSIAADDSLILGTLTSAQTQELSASQSDDHTSGLLLAVPSLLVEVPDASPITTSILEASPETSLSAILSGPPPKRRSPSSSLPPRRSSFLLSSRQPRCLASSGSDRSPFVAASLPEAQFTFSAPVQDKALHAPVADCTELDVSPPLKFSFSSFSSSSLSPETSFTFTPPSTATISASEGVVEVLDAPPSSIPTPLPIYTPPTSLPPFPPFHLSPSTSTINFSADPSASLDHLYAPSAPAPLSRRKSTRLQSRRAPILPYSSVTNADAISTVSFFPAPSSLGYPLTVTTLEVTKSEVGCPNSEEIKYVANIEAAPTKPESKTITNSPEIFRDSNIPSPIAAGHPSVPRLRPVGERFNSGLVQPPSDVITQSLRAFCSSQSESEPVYNVSDHIHHVDNHTNTTEEPSTPSTSTSPSISISISPSPSISISTSLQPEVVFKTSNIEVTASSKSEATPLVNANTNDSPSTLPAQGEQSTTQEPHNPRRPASRRVRKSKKSKKSKNSKK